VESGREAGAKGFLFPRWQELKRKDGKRNPFTPASLPLSTSSEAVYWLWEGKIKGASLLGI